MGIWYNCQAPERKPHTIIVQGYSVRSHILLGLRACMLGQERLCWWCLRLHRHHSFQKDNAKLRACVQERQRYYYQPTYHHATLVAYDDDYNVMRTIWESLSFYSFSFFSVFGSSFIPSNVYWEKPRYAWLSLGTVDTLLLMQVSRVFWEYPRHILSDSASLCRYGR